MPWQRIKESQFITETEDKGVVSAGDLFGGGTYKEYAAFRNGRIQRPEDATHRTQEIDGVLFYYRWHDFK